jgi:pimeloyl-ACP methyl ester carboxylesterase
VRWQVVTRGVLVVLLAVVLVFGLLWLMQRKMIYFPDASAPPPAATILAGGRDVVLRTDDGLRLGAWLAPPTGPDRRVAVLMAPGNGGNRADRAPLARTLAQAGLTILLLDYRGYGGNPGSPSQAGLALDARAARTYLIDQGFAPERMIYFGESLGTAVVTEVSIEYPPGGLVLRSPFTDLAAVGRHHYPVLPVGALLRDRYPVADLIGEITVPTVVVYGSADTIVPPRQSRAVAERAAGLTALVAVEGADHNDPVLLDGSQIVTAVVSLAERIARG